MACSLTSETGPRLPHRAQPADHKFGQTPITSVPEVTRNRHSGMSGKRLAPSGTSEKEETGERQQSDRSGLGDGD